MSEHTPIPWKYNILDDGNFGISAGWTDIATVYNRDDDPVDEANAQFIVRACNSHDDLLAALTELVEHPDDYTSRKRAQAFIAKAELPA